MTSRGSAVGRESAPSLCHGGRRGAPNNRLERTVRCSGPPLNRSVGLSECVPDNCAVASVPLP